MVCVPRTRHIDLQLAAEQNVHDTYRLNIIRTKPDTFGTK